MTRQGSLVWCASCIECVRSGRWRRIRTGRIAGGEEEIRLGCHAGREWGRARDRAGTQGD